MCALAFCRFFHVCCVRCLLFFFLFLISRCFSNVVGFLLVSLCLFANCLLLFYLFVGCCSVIFVMVVVGFLCLLSFKFNMLLIPCYLSMLLFNALCYVSSVCIDLCYFYFCVVGLLSFCMFVLIVSCYFPFMLLASVGLSILFVICLF